MELNEIFYIGRSEEPVQRLDEARQLVECNLVHGHGIASIRGAHGGLWMELNELFYRPFRGTGSTSRRGTVSPRFAVLMEAYVWYCVWHRLDSRCSRRPMLASSFYTNLTMGIHIGRPEEPVRRLDEARQLDEGNLIHGLVLPRFAVLMEAYDCRANA